MKRSEIFDSFVKIAQEKGMISNDSSEAKKKIEQTGRAGSDDISTIEALYGVKPDTSKGMDYKSNIMEAAHPNSVVVSPSYDKLNGLVENNIERQNILLNIVNKPVNGLETHHKYAETQLLLSLVKIGDELDKLDSDELRILNDTCLSQLSNKGLKKQAWVVPVIIGAASLLGGLWLQQHLRMISDGFERDHAKLIAELNDLINSNKDWGVGVKYKASFTTIVQSFKTKMEAFYKLYKTIEPVIEDLEKPRDGKELAEWAKRPDAGKVQQAMDAFSSAGKNLVPEIEAFIKNFSNESYKQRQTQEKGWMTSLLDSTQILHGGKGLIGDDFDDVVRALKTYYENITNINKTLADAGSFQQKAQKDMEQAASKSSEVFSGSSTVLNTPGTTPSQTPSENPLKEHDEKAGDLAKMLGFR